MALRAGYWGIKKLLSPLKLFRPGELGIDQDALVADLGPVFYPRSEQEVTGVVNLFDINAPRTNSAGVTSTVSSSATASSLNITNAEAATYKETDYIGLSFPKNTDLKATFGVTVTSGKGRFYIDGSNDGTNWSSIASSDPITASGNFTVSFNTGNYSSYRIRWYCSFDVSAAGNITYTNIVIKSALDTATNYIPYAMTNQQLTDITQKLDKVENITSSFFATLGTGIEVCTSSKVFVSGNRIVGDVVLKRTVGFTSEVGDTLLNTDYMPLNAINSYAVYQDAEYSITSKVDLGYLYISPYNADVKKIIFKNNTGDSSEIYVKFHLDYIFKSGTANRSLPEATREAVQDEPTADPESVTRSTKKTTKKTASADINE